MKTETASVSLFYPPYPRRFSALFFVCQRFVSHAFGKRGKIRRAICSRNIVPFLNLSLLSFFFSMPALPTWVAQLAMSPTCVALAPLRFEAQQKLPPTSRLPTRWRDTKAALSLAVTSRKCLNSPPPPLPDPFPTQTFPNEHEQKTTGGARGKREREKRGVLPTVGAAFPRHRTICRHIGSGA